MKKKLLSILVILCMILSLAACGSAPKRNRMKMETMS